MREVSIPSDHVPLDGLMEHQSRTSAAQAKDSGSIRHEEIEDACTSSTGVPSSKSNSVIDQTGETTPEGSQSSAEWESGTPELAIDLNDFKRLYFYHGVKRRVLRGLDLKVPKGIIYALIGNRGSAFGSLLKYIKGLLRCPEGRIRVLGKVPGTPGSSVPGPGIGFVEFLGLSLPREFTVGEALRFVGKIYGMSESRIQERIEILSEMLPLPGETVLLKNLTHEDRDSVSLAAGIIHSPSLLVLDEPFGSSNPILRMRLWNYLRTLTREEGVTVLISGSNIEDFQFRADMVGIMSSGRIVAQGSPKQLLKDFKCDTLEEVFVQLSFADEEKPILAARQTGEWPNENVPTRSAPSNLKSDSNGAIEQRGPLRDSLSRVLMLTMMNLTLLKRGKGSFLGVPLFLLFMFCTLAGMTHVFCHQAIPSVDILNVSPNSSENTLNVSATSSGEPLEADREPSPAESVQFRITFSLIFTMGLVTAIIGSDSRSITEISYLTAGMEPLAIVASSFVAQICVMLIQVALLSLSFIGCFRSFDSIDPKSLALVIVLCLLQGFQGMALGMIGSSDRASEHKRMNISIVMFLLVWNTVLSGTAFPGTLEDAMPVVHKSMPQTFPAEALRCIIYRGWGIEKHEVWFGILASIGWSAFFGLMVFGVRSSLRRRQRI